LPVIILTELPTNYPSEYIETVTLNDGLRVTLRPIRPDDAPRLQAGFARLSPQTVYMRFLTTFSELSDKQARQFAEVDYQTRMAFVGSIPEAAGTSSGLPEERLVCVARYAMIGPHEPGVAESAVVVGDNYQNRGLGSIALDRLIRYARTHGVNSFLATVNVSNARIMHIVLRSGLPFERKVLEPGTWEVRIQLEP
jgi:RimJ/RimL family protein N-acetyltransferase